MGHSFQAVSLLVQGPAGHVAAVPLVSRIHEGLIWSNRDTRTPVSYTHLKQCCVYALQYLILNKRFTTISGYGDTAAAPAFCLGPRCFHMRGSRFMVPEAHGR